MIRTRQILSDTVALLRARWSLVAIWTGLFVAWNLVVGVAAGPWLASQAAANGGRVPLAASLPIGLVGICFFAILFAAAMRSVLAPDERRLAYLRLGVDEARLIALILIAIVLLTVGGGVAGIGSALLMGVVGVWAQNPVAVALTGLVAGAVILAGVVYLAIRLMPVPPLTLLRRELAIGRGWRLSERRFRPLFGAWILFTIVVVVVVSVLSIVVLWPVLPALAHPMEPGSAERIAEFRLQATTGLTPMTVAIRCLGAVINGVVTSIHAFLLSAATLRLIDDKAGIG